MNTHKTTLKQLEDFFQQADSGNLQQRLEIPAPDDPLYLLYMQINQFLERLSNSLDVKDSNNPLLTAILDNSPYGIIDIDTHGTIRFTNRLADFLLAKPETTLSGLNLIDLLTKKKADTKTLKLIIEGNSVLHPQRVTISLPDEHDSITLSLSIIPYHDIENNQQQFAILIEDLTGKKTLSDAIEFYTENLESVVKSKTKEIQAMQTKIIEAEQATAMISTAGGIAHELRQPLTAIIGAAELMTAGPGNHPDDSQKRKLEMIYRQSLRMADIIKNMEELVSYQTKDYVTGTKILDIYKSSKQE